METRAELSDRGQFCSNAKRSRRTSAILVAACSVGVFAPSQLLRAAADSYVSNSSTAFVTKTNWSTGAVPVTTDEASVESLVPSAATAFTISASAVYGDLIFNTSYSDSLSHSSGTAHTLTLSGGGVTGAGNTPYGTAIADGGATGDLLLLGTNATANTVTIGASSGGGNPALGLVIGKDGNFDVANQGATLSIAGLVSGNFNLSKTGAGILAFSNANTFGSGKTFTVSTGTVYANGTGVAGTSSSTGLSSVTVNNGATLGGTGTVAGAVTNNGILSPGSTATPISTLTLQNGLTLGANSSAKFDLGANADDKIAVTGALALPSAAAPSVGISLTNSGGFTLNTPIPLFTYTGALSGSFSSLFVSTTPPTGDTFTLQNNSGEVDLLIAGESTNIAWTGAVNGAWDVNTTANWTGNTSHKYIEGDAVTFDDTATGTTNVSIAASGVAPSSVLVNNVTKDYAISGGPITGNATVTKNGSGGLSLSGSNAYIGATTLNAGTLRVNNASAIGSGALVINGGVLDNTSGGSITLSTNNSQNWNGDFAFTGTSDLNLGTGTVTLNANRVVTVNGGNLTVGGIIAGTGSAGLTKNGSGLLSVPNQSATGWFTGPLVINAGTYSVGATNGVGLGTNNVASNIVINGGTLQYALQDANHSSSKLFTIGPNGATIDASSVGSVALSGTGAIAFSTPSVPVSLTLSGSENALANQFSPLLGDNGGDAHYPTSLIKTGVGLWNVTNGSNSFSGGTTVTGGTLITNSNTGFALGTGAIKVGSQGTLGGTGTIAAPTAVLGVVTPSSTGSSTGARAKLTFSSTSTSAALDLSGGGTYVWKLGTETDGTTGTAGTDYDQIVLGGAGGNLVLGGTSKLTLSLIGTAGSPNTNDAFWTINHTWTIVLSSGQNNTNTAGSAFASITDGTYTYGTFTTTADTVGDVSLVYTTPEPASLGLLGFGALMLKRRRRPTTTSRPAII